MKWPFFGVCIRSKTKRDCTPKRTSKSVSTVHAPNSSSSSTPSLSSRISEEPIFSCKVIEVVPEVVKRSSQVRHPPFEAQGFVGASSGSRPSSGVFEAHLLSRHKGSRPSTAEPLYRNSLTLPFIYECPTAMPSFHLEDRVQPLPSDAEGRASFGLQQSLGRKGVYGKIAFKISLNISHG